DQYWVAEMLAPTTVLMRAELDYLAVQDGPEGAEALERYVTAMEATGDEFFTNRTRAGWPFFKRFYALDLSRHGDLARRQEALRARTAAPESVAVALEAKQTEAGPFESLLGCAYPGPYLPVELADAPPLLDPDLDIAAQLEILGGAGPIAYRLKLTGKDPLLDGLAELDARIGTLPERL